MAEIKRSTLFGKLNSIGYKAIEGATIFCKMRGNPYVETVHWLHQLLQTQDSDIHHVLKAFPNRFLQTRGRPHRRVGPPSARGHRDFRFLS
jgi:ATP-dependent Clp protease ATP-binding subunit ClpA